MKVLTFTSLYPNNIWPHQGVFIKERMTRFARGTKCEVKVVAPVPCFPPLKINHRWRFSQVVHREMIEGVEVFHPRYLMTPKVGMSLYGVLMFLSVLPAVKRIQKTFDFNIIDAHFVYPDGFAAVLLGRFLGKPVIVSARGSDINLYKQFPIIRGFLRITLSQAERVIAVSQALKEGMVGLDIAANKITVIPNGVDAEKFFPLSKAEARAKLDLPHKPMLLSVGHLTPVKGFDLLLHSFKLLLDKGQATNLHLSIVGEGGSRKELEGLVSSLGLGKHVRFIGNIPHNELCLWYNAADLFCLASSREGWPNVLLESLACGTPVVAVRVGGIPEIITSDALGLLTERKEEALAEGISIALKKSWQPNVIVRNCREHTWEQVALSLFSIFVAVVGGNQNRREI